MARPGEASRSFRDDECGAVTVDWVAVTAGLLLLGVLVVYAIFNGSVAPLTSSIGTTLADSATWEAVDSDDGGGSTGNAAEQACIKTQKRVVCLGPV